MYAALVKSQGRERYIKSPSKDGQVTMQKMNVIKPLMRYRNIQDDVKTGFLDLTRDKSGGKPAYCPVGIRYRDGMSCMEALSRNVGTCTKMLRENFKQRPCKNESTDALYRDRLARSSEEVAVMAMERRGQLIQLINLNN